MEKVRELRQKYGVRPDNQASLIVSIHQATESSDPVIDVFGTGVQEPTELSVLSEEAMIIDDDDDDDDDGLFSWANTAGTLITPPKSSDGSPETDAFPLSTIGDDGLHIPASRALVGSTVNSQPGLDVSLQLENSQRVNDLANLLFTRRRIVVIGGAGISVAAMLLIFNPCTRFLVMLILR